MIITSLRLALPRRCGVIAIFAALAALPALPQSKPAAAGGNVSGEYSRFDVSPFAGYQWFQLYGGSSPRISKLDPGPVVGVRVTEDLWKYVGLEQSFTAGFNDLLLRPFGLQQVAKADARNYTLALNPLLYFTPRQSKLRPFFTLGPAVTWYAPDAGFKNSVPGALPLASDLKTKYGPALIYGLGLKYNATRRIGLRVDLRGLWTQGRHYGLPIAPYGPGAFYSPDHRTEAALAVTGGIVFRFGHAADKSPAPPAPAPAPAPAPPPPAPAADISISGISGARDVCPGETVSLNVSARGWLPDQTPSYQWVVDGQPATGANAATFTLPASSSPGARSVAVRVSAPGSSKTSDPVTVRVKDAAAPTVSFPLSQSTIPFGTRLPLTATATASECGGAPSIAYSASEGSVSGDVFDSGTLTFDRSNRLKQQTKVVRLTATATDRLGKTGSATSEVTVTLSPEARRLDDIVFPANSARVNNCAKRLLLEQLTPMLRDDPNATVILIGHRDQSEKGKAAASLDRVRALNAAAVLSAGTGICPQLELSRMKVNWVGAEQNSPAKPLLCGASTDVKERGGQAVKSSDQRAQFRRVEVWIVPGGAAMPAEATGLRDVPAAEVKKLGCPR
jgi:outer membrane protein OmpA-like peptidoglycan-associated protein